MNEKPDVGEQLTGAFGKTATWRKEETTVVCDTKGRKRDTTKHTDERGSNGTTVARYS